MVWDGDVMQYQSFKKQILELLDYDNPSLELETLKQQIKGPKASLFNVRDKADAFKVFESEYGNILMVFPRIKADFESLKDLPTSMVEESANIQEIINVTQTLENYGKKEAIYSGFIQQFCNKLRRENRRWIMKEKIDNCDDFVAALYEMLAINDELKITSFQNEEVYKNQFSIKTD